MTDTTFYADESRIDRLAALYVRHPETGHALRQDWGPPGPQKRPAVLSGGGGLMSTTSDYIRFTRMLARGGELDGVRIVSPHTLALMTSNHLDGDLGSMSTGGFAETTFDGVGFGLGFATVLDPIKLRNSSSPGEFYWGGAFSTAFWVDPVQDVTCVFMTQLMPSSTYPIRAELRQLVYSALVS
jgi:CubicO group peptidase (beta-lactamase class C family)